MRSVTFRVEDATAMHHDLFIDDEISFFRSELLLSSEDNNVNIQWTGWVNKLNEVRSLPEDWDGDGAESPRSELVDEAIYLLQILKKQNIPLPSRIIPSLDGGVIIEWHIDGVYIEAELSQGNVVEWMYSEPGMQAKHWEEILSTSRCPAETWDDLFTNAEVIQEDTSSVPYFEAA